MEKGQRFVLVIRRVSGRQPSCGTIQQVPQKELALLHTLFRRVGGHHALVVASELEPEWFCCKQQVLRLLSGEFQQVDRPSLVVIGACTH